MGHSVHVHHANLIILFTLDNPYPEDASCEALDRFFDSHENPDNTFKQTDETEIVGKKSEHSTGNSDSNKSDESSTQTKKSEEKIVNKEKVFKLSKKKQGKTVFVFSY